MPTDMTLPHLSPQALEQVAAYFQVLSEPNRLQLLNLLKDGEKNVGELAQCTHTSTANTSRHLALMAQRGIVARRCVGNNVFYAIADPTVYDICQVVCGAIANRYRRMDTAGFASIPAAPDTDSQQPDV